MPKFVKLLLVFIILSICACDGRVRVLYLKPPEVREPPWSAASVTIPVQGSEDVLHIITAIASELGLKQDTTDTNLRYGVNYNENRIRKSFIMTAEKVDGGYWKIALLDWPEVSRSELSLKAEARIRAALKAEN